MTGLLLYIGKVAVLLAVFCLFYRLLMERETFHRLNRAVLLLSVLAAFILPLCEITHHRTVLSHEVTLSPPESGGARGGLNELQSDGSLFRPPLTPPDSGGEIVTAVLFFGMIMKLLHTVVSLYRLRRFITQCEQHPQKDGTVIAVSEQNLAPFSWWNTIVLSRADYEAYDPALLAHEQAHIGSYHSVDILLMELVVALQWFNPAAWLMARDLRTVHEYEADEAVLARGIDTHHYLSLLMERANTSNRYALTNGISQKTLKSRFLMMARHRSKPSHIFRLLYALPVIGCALALNARTVTDIKYLPIQANESLSEKPLGLKVESAEKKTTSVTLPETRRNHQQTIRRDIAKEQEAPETSEQVAVSGYVTDEQGEPIIGAAIVVRDHTLGTVSDFDGHFSINIPKGAVLDIMYIGVATVSLQPQQDLKDTQITLKPDGSDKTE